MEFKQLKERYDLKITGILHIGANVGQEHTMYEEMGIKAMYFEPVPECFRVLKSRVGDKAINCALGNFTGNALMYESSNGASSSSLLKPLLHRKQYPQVEFERTIIVDVKKLDNIKTEGYNTIVIDVQGYELEVFKGGASTLSNIEYIYTEVNRAMLYEGCAQVSELDKYLCEFLRVDTEWIGCTWGDALYIRL